MSIYKYLMETVGDDIDRPINEAVYFGKTKEVLKIEEGFQKLIEIYQKNPVLLSKDFTNQIRVIENSISKFVNCEDTVLEVGNATFATVPVYLTLDDFFLKSYGDQETFKRTITDSTGVRFLEPKGKTLFIMISPVHLLNLSAGELTAIILHELGHNLELQHLKTVHNVLGLFSFQYLVALLVTNIMKACYKIVNTDMISKDIVTKLTFLLSIPKLFIQLVLQILSKILPTSIITALANILVLLKSGSHINGQIFIIKKLFAATAGYDGEKYSDAYASAFGYAPELASGLRKLNMKDLDKALNHIPFFTVYASVRVLLNDCLRIFFVPHPSELNRILNNIQYLESTVDDITNPKAKAQAKEDIKVLKELVENIANDKYEILYVRLNAQAATKSEYRPTDIRELVTQYRDWDSSKTLGEK